MSLTTDIRRVYGRISGATSRALAERLASTTEELARTTEELARVRSEHSVLSTRVTELMAQIRALARRADLEGPRPSSTSPAPAAPAASKRRAKFITFSNPRSGSTWLETMLGLLPDVHVDYELKWGAAYSLRGIGVAIDAGSRTVSQVLEDMQTDAPVSGSKFVFDAPGLTPLDFQKLRGRIGPDVRLIHITRSYRDIFLSMARGFYHAPARMDSLSDRLREAIEKADVARAVFGPPQTVAPLVCFRQLAVLLDNDLNIRSLREPGSSYIQISYEDVGKNLTNIVRFAGSEASAAAIADVLAHPAVAKLPDFDGDSVITNLAELEPLFEAFEILRAAMVVERDAVASR